MKLILIAITLLISIQHASATEDVATKPVNPNTVQCESLQSSGASKELLMEKFDCYVVESVNGGERITIMKEELANMRAISAVVPPSKHKQ